jgi:RNA polymerase sigma factor (sigma-70 family)
MQNTYNQLLKQYTRYIEKLANSWSNGDYELTKDLEQIGNIRLFEIMNQIDEEKGNPTSYVTTMVKYAMIDYLTNNLRTVRIPASRQHGKRKEEHLIESVSLSSQPFHDFDTTLLDLIVIEEDDNSPTDEQLIQKQRILKALNEMKPKWRYILTNYHGYNEDEAKMTLQEIGDKLGVSKEAVRQILEKAEERFKKIIK